MSKGIKYLLLLTQENNKSDFLLKISNENTFYFFIHVFMLFSNKWQFKNERKF